MASKIPKFVLNSEKGLTALRRKIKRTAFNTVSEGGNEGATVFLFQMQSSRRHFDRRLRVLIPMNIEDELHNRLCDETWKLFHENAQHNPWAR